MLKFVLVTRPIPTDEVLISQAKNGETGAFRSLVLRHQHQVRATVIGMLGKVVESEDVAQEVFIRFYRSLHKFRGEAQLSTYLTRIAINLSLTELKKRKKRHLSVVAIEGTTWPQPIEDESAHPDRQDNQQLIERALEELDPGFRAVVVLRMLQGYSTQETATLLDIPLGTVASRLSRAQLQLRNILEKWEA
ncbi:MAG: RNA polymerase sigma factor [Saprospiraceae bacterium]|nr:MAG: RNA polymerase sigma factor [Saprospiraceae bacterium]